MKSPAGKLPPVLGVFCFDRDIKRAEEDLLLTVRGEYYRRGEVNRKNVKITDEYTSEQIVYSASVTSGKPMFFRVKSGKSVIASSRPLKSGLYAVELFERDGKLRKTYIFNCDHRLFKLIYFDAAADKSVACEMIFAVRNGVQTIFRTVGGNPTERLYQYKPDYDFDPQTLAAGGRVSLPVKVYADGEEWFASLKEIDALNNEAQRLHLASKAFVPKSGGFGFTPEAFENTGEPFTLESLIKQSEPAAEPCAPTQDISLSPESAALPTEEDNSASAPEEQRTEPSPEEAPDCVINTPEQRYLYYGAVDSQGNRTGIGRTMQSDGKIAYYGEYELDKRSGFGMYCYKNGAPCYVGEWRDNKRNGLGTAFRSSDGVVQTGVWKNDKADGKAARFDKDGNLRYVAEFSDGQLNGIHISFDMDGNIIISKFVYGKRNEKVKIISTDDL